MKVYQEKWAERLMEGDTAANAREVCQEILADDTGGTDILSTTLARQVLLLLPCDECNGNRTVRDNRSDDDTYTLARKPCPECCGG